MLRRLSIKLYAVSSIPICLFAMVVMVLYAQLIMGGMAAEYNSSFPEGMKVPDLMFGYDRAYVMQFMDVMGKAQLLLYRNVVVIWDTIFPVVYTAMNVLLLSYIYKNAVDSRVYWINLLPLLSIPLDLFENSFEVMMVNDYLNNTSVATWMIAGGSIAGMVKWCFTYFLYALLGFGILRLIAVKLRS